MPTANLPQKLNKRQNFNVQLFLTAAGVAGNTVGCRRSQKIYSQGEPAQTVMYIHEGGVKLSVVSKVGKEAIVALLGPGDFFGEGCLTGLPFRMTATAITPTTVVVTDDSRSS
jgi:CRP/FNR family cyclic AMP-dependent transcriptional regulator